MENWGEKLEQFIDRAIPFVLILLLFIIICEFFFVHFYERWSYYFLATDIIILGLFILDLTFKYQRAKSVPYFLRHYWLDIIAVFPFFLVFRVFETVGFIRGTVEAGQEAQKLFHAGLEVEKQIKGVSGIEREIKVVSELDKEARIIKEVEMAAKEGARSEKLLRFLRPILKTPRLSKGVKFFEHPERKNNVI